MIPRGNKRFWSSTRGRIILLLRRGSHTVNDLAKALGVTDNAIRAHLTALERDGLVRQSGTRPGTRKPNLTYDLASDADQLFPKAYGPLLRHLLDSLSARMAPRKLEEILRDVGRRIARNCPPGETQGPPADPAERAAAMLREFGGLCETQRHNGNVTLSCHQCPLEMVAIDHPEICAMMETALAEALGVSVQQRCQSAPTPRCRFEIGGARRAE